MVVPLFILNYSKPWGTDVISNARHKSSDEENYYSTSQTRSFIRYKSICFVQDIAKEASSSFSRTGVVYIDLSSADKKSTIKIVCEPEEIVALNPKHKFLGIEL